MDYFISADVLEHPNRSATSVEDDAYSEQVLGCGSKVCCRLLGYFSALDMFHDAGSYVESKARSVQHPTLMNACIHVCEVWSLGMLNGRTEGWV